MHWYGFWMVDPRTSRPHKPPWRWKLIGCSSCSTSIFGEPQPICSLYDALEFNVSKSLGIQWLADHANHYGPSLKNGWMSKPTPKLLGKGIDGMYADIVKLGHRTVPIKHQTFWWKTLKNAVARDARGCSEKHVWKSKSFENCHGCSTLKKGDERREFRSGPTNFKCVASFFQQVVHNRVPVASLNLCQRCFCYRQWSGPVFIKLGQWLSTRRDIIPSLLASYDKRVRSFEKWGAWYRNQTIDIVDKELVVLPFLAFAIFWWSTIGESVFICTQTMKGRANNPAKMSHFLRMVGLDQFLALPSNSCSFNTGMTRKIPCGNHTLN